MAYKSSIEGTKLTFLRRQTLTPMASSPFVMKKNKNEEEQEEEGNQLVQLFFAAMLQHKPLMKFLRKTFNRIKPY